MMSREQLELELNHIIDSGANNIRILELFDKASEPPFPAPFAVNKPMELLNKTGYSYSGISDVVRNTPERKNELLFAIDSEYCRLRDEAKEAQDKLDKAESSLSYIVSCFLHLHQVLVTDGIIDEDVLSYTKPSENVNVLITGANSIKYTHYKRADLNPTTNE